MNYFVWQELVDVPLSDKIITLLSKLKTSRVSGLIDTQKELSSSLKSPWGYRYYFHFTDEKTESQRASTASISP